MSTKWKEVVEKLLTKAENPAVTFEERKALVEKATELMAKFGIEEAMLWSKSEKREEVTSIYLSVKGTYKNSRYSLINGIARTFGCYAIVLKDDQVRVFGFEGDLEKIRVLYHSLLLQCFIELNQAQKPTGEHGKSFNLGFLNGYVSTVIRRVKEAYRKIKQASGPGTDVVLYDREKLVRKSFNMAYPMRSELNGSRSSSYSGAAAGRAAGNRADVGQTRIGGRRELTR